VLSPPEPASPPNSADFAAALQNPLHRRSEFADYRKASNGDEFAVGADIRRRASEKVSFDEIGLATAVDLCMPANPLAIPSHCCAVG
jgi:hypothetical protein